MNCDVNTVERAQGGCIAIGYGYTSRVFFVITYLPIGLSVLILAAHFVRVGNFGASTAILLLGGLAFSRQRWTKTILQLFLGGAALFWAKTLIQMIHIRLAISEPWIRLSIIMAAVVGLCIGAAISLERPVWQRRISQNPESATASAVAFILTAALLSIVQLKVARPMLLPERFLFGGGWIAIVLLAGYAATLVQKMRLPREARIWRKRIWILFGGFFFLQLVAGLLVDSRFLMGPTLHVPVPAVIIGGPLFRGSGFFMLILLSVTLLLAGPAWCSYLCYFGGFDLLAASSKPRPLAHRKWFWILRIVLLAATIGVAAGLRRAGVAGQVAAVVAIGFGLVGIGSMVWVSRRMGSMFHCSSVCPVGLVAVVAGKISPFRMRFTSGCDGCGACGLSCPTGALEKQHIAARGVGWNCTLCGDCLAKCKTGGLAYQFARWRNPAVRTAFLVIVISLHAVFLGVARV